MPTGPLPEFFTRQIHQGRKTLAKLGTYPSTTLAAARAAHAELIAPIRAGEHVRAHRDKVRNERRELATLTELCEAYAQAMQGDGRRSAPEIRRVLLNAPDAACRVIGGYRPACTITPGEVAAWLRPKARTAPAAARQARAWISAAYGWALKMENSYTREQPHRFGLTGNPASAVPADTTSQRAGMRFLSPEEFRRVWRWLASEGGRSDQRACNALRVLLATGQRVEEIVHLRAGQYADGWIRWDTTKTGTGHSIPLPPQARAILDSMEPNAHGLYFPGFKRPGEPYRAASLVWIARRCAKQLGIPVWTPRDLRRTVRTLWGDAGLPPEACAMLMNHAAGSNIPKIERVHYNRSDNAPLKTEAMKQWSVFLAKILAGTVDSSAKIAGPRKQKAPELSEAL